MNMALSRLRADLGREDAIIEVQGQLRLNPELWSVDAWEIEAQLSQAAPSDRIGLRSQLDRGFVGPTSIPAGMRHRVPQRGARDLGPKPLLPWIEGDI